MPHPYYIYAYYISTNVSRRVQALCECLKGLLRGLMETLRGPYQWGLALLVPPISSCASLSTLSALWREVKTMGHCQMTEGQSGTETWSNEHNYRVWNAVCANLHQIIMRLISLMISQNSWISNNVPHMHCTVLYVTCVLHICELFFVSMFNRSSSGANVRPGITNSGINWSRMSE